MSKKNETAPYEREMTPGELAANDAHLAAHARALEEEREQNEIIKKRIAKGDIDPSIDPSQLPVTPQAQNPRAADVYRTSAEQHGNAVIADEPAPSKSSKK